jgi:hypothetical protein
MLSLLDIVSANTVPTELSAPIALAALTALTVALFRLSYPLHTQMRV